MSKTKGLASIPSGLKENIYFIVDNGRNISRREKKKKKKE